MSYCLIYYSCWRWTYVPFTALALIFRTVKAMCLAPFVVEGIGHGNKQRLIDLDLQILLHLQEIRKRTAGTPEMCRKRSGQYCHFYFKI